MSKILLEKPFPGATTGILIGDAHDFETSPVKSFQHLLWFADRDTLQRSRLPLPSSVVETAHIEETSARQILEKFLRHDPRHLPSVFVAEIGLGPHALTYRRIIADVYSTLESHHRGRVTRQKDGFIWQRHLLENLTDYATHRVPFAWADALKGMPAFVCGAGPSLDVSAPVLAAHAADGVVFAADSSLRALARHGVTADFAVSVDAAKLPEKCLPSDHAPTRVVLSAVSPPTWRESVTEDRLYLSSSQLTLDWLGTQGIPRTPISVAENCGATALELARFLGCAPIYLFGLDLAVGATDQARRHNTDADATLYTHSGYDPSQDLPRVPGNHTAAVPTFAYGDWQALDARLAGWPTDLVFNVNDRGARFRNTTVIHPESLRFTPGNVVKADALAQLASVEPLSDTVLSAALDRVRSASALGRTKAAQIRQALSQKNPGAAATLFRQLFADQTFARVFGAFSLKVMPHLVPPIESEPALWQILVDELDQLATVASA